MWHNFQSMILPSEEKQEKYYGLILLNSHKPNNRFK